MSFDCGGKKQQEITANPAEHRSFNPAQQPCSGVTTVVSRVLGGGAAGASPEIVRPAAKNC